MVHRIPLIVNASASQIQELPTSDTLAGGVPLGAILMWGGGNTIPTGFTLCNAANAGTVNGIVVPNLEDKFIIGAKQHDSGWKTNITGSLGTSGGSKDATLPTHFHHAFKLGNSNEEQYNSTLTASNYAASGTGAGNLNEAYNIVSKTTEADVGKTSDEGAAATNANLPPYIALAYIIRTS